MATILSKTFDTVHAVLILQVRDALGNVSSHTGYVTGPQPITDVDAWITQVCADVDANAAAIQAAFSAAGWTPNGV